MKTVKTFKSRKTIHFLAVTLVVVMFASCGQNEPIENFENFGTTDNIGTEVRFTGSIAQQAILDHTGTRMAGTNWEKDDAIGIFMSGHDSNNKIQPVNNKKYTTTGDGTFSPFTGNELYYPVEGTLVDFVAYYPYIEDATNGQIRVKVQTEQTADNQKEFDLLTAVNRKGHSKTSGSVTLQFEHKLSKLVIYIVQPDELSPNTTGLCNDDLKDMEIKINGEGQRTKCNIEVTRN